MKKFCLKVLIKLKDMIDRSLIKVRQVQATSTMEKLKDAFIAIDPAAAGDCKILEGYFKEDMKISTDKTVITYDVMDYRFCMEYKIFANYTLIRTFDNVYHTDRLIEMPITLQGAKKPISELDIIVDLNGNFTMKDFPKTQSGKVAFNNFSGLLRGYYCEKLSQYVDSLDKSMTIEELKALFG